MDRRLNYIFLLLLVYIFTLWAPVNARNGLILGIIASLLFCSIAYLFRWLTLSGAAAAIIVGTVTFGLGGWPLALALIAFFLTSALISQDHSPAETMIDEIVRRNGIQVWANGFWVVIWLMAGIITQWAPCWMAASAALATATADTWATELGSQRFNVKTYLINSGQTVAAGSQGGISWPGLAASLAGSGLIAGIIYLGFPVGVRWLFYILLSGFIGAFFDSLLGASIQEKTYKSSSRFWRSKEIRINNDAVNWMATGFSSLLILILNLLIL